MGEGEETVTEEEEKARTFLSGTHAWVDIRSNVAGKDAIKGELVKGI